MAERLLEQHSSSIDIDHVDSFMSFSREMAAAKLKGIVIFCIDNNKLLTIAVPLATKT
jgi:ABC-type hemin transport system ATPase subunit